MGGGAGVAACAVGTGSCGGQREQPDAAVLAGGLVLLHPALQKRQQAAAQHPIAPHQRGILVFAANQRQKITDGLRQPGGISLGIAAVRGQMLGKALPGDGVMPRRIVEGVVIVRAQIDDDGVCGPGGKVIGLHRAGGVGLQAADLCVIGCQRAARVVVPAGYNAPAALADKPIVRAKGIGSHPGIVVLGRKKGRYPVGFTLRTNGTLAAGDAVADKFQPHFGGGQRLKITAVIFQRGNLQQMARVNRHRLHVLQQADVLHRAGGHTAEQADAALARAYGKARIPRAVQLHADPRLIQGVVTGKVHPQLGTVKQQLYAGGGPVEGQRVAPSVAAQRPHGGQGR